MHRSRRPDLSKAVLNAFRQSLQAGRKDIAEHLLAALESLASTNVHQSGNADSALRLVDAYTLIGKVRRRPPAVRHRRGGLLM